MSTLPFDQERRRRQQRRGVIEAGTGRPATFREFAEGAKEAIDQQVGQETQVESPQRFADFLSSTREGQEAISTDMQIAQAEQQLAKLGQSTLTPGIAADAGPQQRLQALQQRVERASGPQAQQLQEFQREAQQRAIDPNPLTNPFVQATLTSAFPIETILGETAGLGLEAGARALGAPQPIQTAANILGNIGAGGLAGARLARGGTSEFGRQITPGNVRTGRSIEPGATGAVTDAAGQAARATGRAVQQAPEQIQRQTDRLRPTSRAFAAGEDIDQPRQPVQRGFEGVQPDQPRADPEAAERFMQQGQLGEEGAEEAGRLAQQRRAEIETPETVQRQRDLEDEQISEVERLEREVEELDALADAAADRSRQVVRPPWATGISNQELERAARAEGTNPFQEDWWDRLDSEVIRGLRRGEFKRAADRTVTQIRSQRAEARRQLRRAREEAPEVQRPAEPETPSISELDDEQVGAMRQIFRDFSDDELNDLLRAGEVDEIQEAAARQELGARQADELPDSIRVDERTGLTGETLDDLRPPTPEEAVRIRQASDTLAQIQPEATRGAADAPPSFGGAGRGGARVPPPGGRGTQGDFGDAFGRPDVPEGRFLRDVRPVDTHYRMAFEPTRALRLAQKMADTPVISNILRAANPASVAKRPGQRIAIARASAVDEANNRVARAASHVLAVGTREQVFGRLDDVGRIAEGPLRGRTLNEIAERPDRFRDRLTREQQVFINRLKDISQERFNLMRRNGLNVRELRFADGGEFADRIVLGRRNPDGELIDAQTVSLPQGASLVTRRGFERSRTFQDVRELQEQGYEVLPYDEAVFTNARGAYRRVVDKQVQEWLIRNIDTRPLSEGAPRAGREFQLPQILPQRVITGRQAGQVRDDLEEAFRREEVGRFARRVLGVSQVARFTVLVGDASIFLIQLLKATFRHPNAVARSSGAFTDQLVRSLLDPQAASKARASKINANRDLMEKMPGLLVGSDQEFTEAVNRGLLSPQRIRALGARGGAPGRAAAEVPARGFEAFTNAFDVAMDTAGINIARGLEHLATDASRTRQIEDYVNNVRGMTSSARLGIPARRRVEEGIALLAPRYRRAVFADHASALQGGLRGSLARRSYTHLVAGLMFTGAALTIAQGINEGWSRRRLETELKQKLNPVSPRFMLWRIGGQNVGPGSKYLSDLRLAGRVITDPEGFTDFSDFSKNSGVRWVRGQLGFVPGTAWSIFEGRNYIGERTRPDNLARPTTDGMLALGRTLFAENLTPLWTQTALLEGGTISGRALRASGDFFGLRAFPQGSLDILNEESFSRFGQEYENLEPYQKDDLRTDLEDRIGPLEEQRVEQGDEFAQYFNEIDKLEQRRIDREQEALQWLRRGYDDQRQPYDRSRFLDDYFDAQAEARARKTQLQTDMGVEFEEENPDASEPNKQALRAWWDAFDQATSPAGNFNVDAYNQIQQQLFRQFTPEQRSYVLRNSNRKDHPEGILPFLPQSTQQDILRSQQARQQHRQRTGGRRPQQSSGSAIGPVRGNPLEAVGGR